jgi:cysteine desulfurase/selenocysteine lyase
MTSEAFAAARRDFPATEETAYLDVAARAILSRPVREAVDWVLDDAMMNGGQKHLWMEKIEATRARFARLIGAEADEIAYTKNVSEGINVIAAGLPWKHGDNVVVAAEAEHPNNIYPWLNLRRLGVELKVVPVLGGEIRSEAVLGAIDAKTRLVSVASQTFSPGLRTDLDPIGAECRRRGIFFLVDGVQSVGVLDMDVRKSNIDGLAVATSKGLLGLYGMGFLYCRREWAERIEPAYLARFGVDLSDGHEADMGDFAYRLMDGARRFDLGNYNFPAVYAAHASLERLLELGTPAIERHATMLARRLAEELAELGFEVYGLNGRALGSIVCAGKLGGGHDRTGDEATVALYDKLVAAGVRLSVRRSVLRFSFHLYNSEADIERVVGVVREAGQSHQRQIA